MTFVKKIFIVFSILVVLPFVIAYFLPTTYSAEEFVEISKPKNDVYKYVVYFKNFKKYDERLSRDKNLKCEYKKKDGREGFSFAWKSKKKDVGAGKINLVEIIKDDQQTEIHYQADYYKPYAQAENGYFILMEESDSTTNVVWKIDGKISYPTNILFLWNDFDKKTHNKQIEGLKKLQEILE